MHFWHAPGHPTLPTGPGLIEALAHCSLGLFGQRQVLEGGGRGSTMFGSEAVCLGHTAPPLWAPVLLLLTRALHYMFTSLPVRVWLEAKMLAVAISLGSCKNLLD